jgi:hypothetical protein
MYDLVPSLIEGRFAIVTDVGSGMRWTRQCRQTSGAECGRRSRVVLMPRRWRQVGGDDLPAMVARKPITRESTKQAVKTIAQGMPGVTANLW